MVRVNFKRCTAAVLSCLILFSSVMAQAADSDASSATTQSVQDAQTTSDDSSLKEISYNQYLSNYGDKTFSDKKIVLTADNLTSNSTGVEIKENYEGQSGKTMVSGEEGLTEYRFTAEQAGFYNITVHYYPVEGRGSAIEREMLVNGLLPYEEAREINFSRIWTNETDIQRDSHGNDIRPTQVESPAWMDKTVSDSMGYITEPLRIYLNAGENVLGFESVREPMAIYSLTLSHVSTEQSYTAVKSSYVAKGYAATSGQIAKVQGEDAEYKSDPIIYPIYDRSSPQTESSDPAKIRLNTIGGDKWKSAGQWVKWKIHVDQTGLYRIAVKARQNIINGAYSTRKLYIDGEVPFQEAEFIRFYYDTQWQMQVLQANGEDMEFYLTAGDHELKLEVSLGDIASLEQKVNECMDSLNTIYRQILMITGPSPDLYRDYQFNTTIPEVLEKLDQCSQQLKDVYEEYKAITGQNGEQAQILNKLYIQTQAMVENPRTIAQRFSTFKSNIGSLGTWLLLCREQPLEIDYIVVLSDDVKLPNVKAGAWASLVYNTQAFIASFTEDYNSISGETGDPDVTVWVGSGGAGTTGGRDQAQVLKRMIDSNFSSKTQISVDIQLVAAGSLLPATLAGKGPDVALSLSGSDPVNYAVRNAVFDLSQFSDIGQVASRFMDSAMVPLSFNGGIYGLPESQTFYMMFYRKDIMQELGINVPDTWDDVLNILPVIQKNQMEFGLPQPIAADSVGIGFSAFNMFLLQNGGQLYRNDGSQCLLNSQAAVNAFFVWTDYYNNYGLTKTYDFLNRFRTGEVPIGIADYTMYNTLSVLAPEISGLWGFTLVPGTVQSNGEINRSVAGSISACVIMKSAKSPEKSWEFLKWWTDSSTQSGFGVELESIMGASARHATANKAALEQIPWSQANLKKIKAQWSWVKGVPEVPGGYFTPRYIDFAFRKATDSGDDPGECMEDVTKTINREILKKRREFGLTVTE